MKTLADMWERNARFDPDHTGLVFEDTRRSHRELLLRGRKLASALHKLGVRRQDRVGMLAMNNAEWFDYYAACHTAGFVAGTINFRLAPPEIEWILKDGAHKALIFEAQYTDAVDAIRGQLPETEHYICISPPPATTPTWAKSYDEVFASGDEAGAPFRPSPQDIAELIYTSGTTGRPKGVARPHSAEVAMARSLSGGVGMTPTGRILLMMPMFHIGALSESLGQLVAGGTVVLQRAFVPAEVLAAIEREKITMTHMAPTMVQQVLDLPEIKTRDLSSLQILCYAAAPMPVSVLRKGIELLGPIFMDQYGSTEMGPGTVLHLHRHVLDGPEAKVKRLASVGQPFPDVELRVLDEQDRDCPPNVTGELCARGDGVMAYYWNNSNATKEAMFDGWHRSGDMGYLDEQGFLYLVDRKKDMIISGGENIYCREVEEALMEHGGLVDVAVIGVPDEKWGESVKAIAIRKPGATVSEDELIAFCTTRIARYKRPKSVDFVAELPRLPSGKIRKNVLREQYRA
jgi:acyl-CoA synthetase (AMP-forming)/AMP-acid ligase II